MSEQTVDPRFSVTAFDREAFEAQVRQAFYTYRRALGEFKPAICRQVMTDDLWEQVKAQAARMQAEGTHEVAERVDIVGVQLLAGGSDGFEDHVVADLGLSGVDYVSDIATGDVRSGSRDARQWTERWTLRRSRDPQVLAAAEEPRCPYCGAPLAVDQDGACGFCRAVVPGPRNAWLASGIAVAGGPQESPASPDADAPLAGLMDRAEAIGHDAGAGGRQFGTDAAATAGILAIKAHDPDFNPIDFAARARDVFMALLQARATLDGRLVRPFLGDALWAEESQRMVTARGSRRNSVRAYLEVSSVEIIEAASTDGWDSLVVRVASQAAEHLVDLDNEVVIGGAESTRTWSDRLTFRRAATCHSSAISGFLAGRCPACAAPARVTADGHCGSCGRPVTSGELDWILASVVTTEA